MIQRTRFEGSQLTCNADMGVAEVREVCVTDAEGRSLLRAAMTQLGMSARSYHRILKLARTIADPEGATKFGYEITFNRYFYKPQPLRSLEEIRADILALERETEGLLSEIINIEKRD